ncbi:Uncharacterized protein pbN1_32910 [Aromatoleum bremense]|nr:Uncharacterized protein pbN1_32910 [Aromatoleum bremense]
MNARIYYLKGPVLTFGIVFPLLFYRAFAAGHDAPVSVMVPGIAAMALFFTASAVGPLITAHIDAVWPLLAGWLLGATAFSSLGVLMAAPATDTPHK